MPDEYKTLFQESNAISLRTASVGDDGDLVDFRLMPAWLESSILGSKPKGFDWVSQDCAWLYRHRRSWLGERKLMRIYPGILQQELKPLVFDRPPEFKLIWTDSGNGVALYLNGEPWAFIDERTHTGYSKGILKAPDMTPWRKLKEKPIRPMPWNQELFEKIFKGV